MTVLPAEEKVRFLFCSRKTLLGAALLDAKEKDPSRPVKIQSKGQNQFSPKRMSTHSMKDTINHASWQALKGHDFFFFLYLK